MIFLVKIGKKRIQITLSESQLEKLEKISKEKGLSKSVVVSLAIDELGK